MISVLHVWHCYFRLFHSFPSIGSNRPFPSHLQLQRPNRKVPKATVCARVHAEPQSCQPRTSTVCKETNCRELQAMSSLPKQQCRDSFIRPLEKGERNPPGYIYGVNAPQEAVPWLFLCVCVHPFHAVSYRHGTAPPAKCSQHG